MNKKIIVFIILFITILGLFIYSQNKKIYLSDKYYDSSEYINVTKNEIDNLKKDNYLLYTYNSYCVFKVPCDSIFKKVMDKYNISILSMPIEEFKKTKYYNKVKYAPSVIIVKHGRIKGYLDANSDDDFNKYQNEKEFEKWLSKYIYLKK